MTRRPPAAEPVESDPIRATVCVEKMIPGGAGLARLPDGEIVLIPGAAPGDELAIIGRRRRSGARTADIEAILSPSPDRRQPAPAPCPACDWSHLTREAQLREKRLLLLDCLTRVGKMPDVAVEETLAPPSEWSRRDKVALAIDETCPQSVRIGYRRPASREVVPYAGCDQAPAVLQDIVAWLTARWPGQTGAASLTLRRNEMDELLISFDGETLRSKPLEALATSLREAFPAIVGVDAHGREGHRALSGDAFLRHTLGQWTFEAGSDSFFQVNRAAASLLLGAVQEALRGDAPQGGGGETAFDIGIDAYAGVGAFTFALAESARRVIAIESADGAIADFARNCELNDAQHVESRHGDVATILQTLDDATVSRLDVAIVDPPRAGCAPEVLQWLATHVRRTLLMISCDPATLARDLKRLRETGDWRIDRIQPVDMFADTHHVETLVRLTRVAG